MKAAVHRGYGPPEAVRVAEVDQPTYGPADVLVRIRATTVNRTDCGFRAAKPFVVRFFGGLVRPRSSIWGTEFAGEVAAVGSDVTSFQVGDRVFGYNEKTFGAHAEYMTIAASGSLSTMPAGLTFDEAAPATEGAHYALTFIRRARIASGDEVLVYGATGAIGSAAVQLLKHLGAKVTAVCATEHVELVKGLGADRVIDYTVEDFTADGRTYVLVLDAVGKISFGACKRSLRPRGMYMSSELGPYGQNPLLALVTPLLRGRKVVFPIPKDEPETVTYLKGLMESGAYRPVIDRRYPLDQIVDAYRYVESGRKVGNVVITVSG